MVDERSAEERRNELLAAKDELIKVMRQVIEPINLITCKLDVEADALINEVMREKNTAPRVRAIKYSDTPRESDTMRGLASPKLGKGKRACSICRQPGHRSTTCPQAKGAFNNVD